MKHHWMLGLFFPLMMLCSQSPALASAEAEMFDCLIQPSQTVDIGSEVQGVIERILVNEGETVESGQTVATLKSAVERAFRDQALARVDMDSEIKARTADLALARQVLDRHRNLHAKRLVSQQELDEAETRFQVAEAAYRHAQDNARLAQLELQRYEALLEQRTLKSPIDGVVVRRHLEPGELVTESPVMTIVQLDELKVSVVLPAQELGRFKPGSKADIYAETNPERSLPAEIDRLDPILDAQSGTFGVTLVLENADLRIHAGQACRVRFVPLVG